MKKFLVLLAAACLLCNRAMAADAYVVAKVVDRADVATFKVMTAAELKTLQTEIQTEARLLPKAMMLTRKAWDKDPENKAFPGGAVNRRSADPVGPAYKDQGEAEEKAQHLTDAAVAKRVEAEEKAEQKIRSQYSGDKRKEKLAEAATKETERKAEDDKARALFEEQLNTLKTPGAPAAGAAP